jgi:hypothetical protein
MDQVYTAGDGDTLVVLEVPFQIGRNLFLQDSPVVASRRLADLIAAVLSDEFTIQRVNRNDTLRWQIGNRRIRSRGSATP